MTVAQAEQAIRLYLLRESGAGFHRDRPEQAGSRPAGFSGSIPKPPGWSTADELLALSVFAVVDRLAIELGFGWQLIQLHLCPRASSFLVRRLQGPPYGNEALRETEVVDTWETPSWEEVQRVVRPTMARHSDLWRRWYDEALEAAALVLSGTFSQKSAELPTRS